MLVDHLVRPAYALRGMQARSSSVESRTSGSERIFHDSDRQSTQVNGTLQFLNRDCLRPC